MSVRRRRRGKGGGHTPEMGRARQPEPEIPEEEPAPAPQLSEEGQAFFAVNALEEQLQALLPEEERGVDYELALTRLKEARMYLQEAHRVRLEEEEEQGE